MLGFFTTSLLITKVIRKGPKNHNHSYTLFLEFGGPICFLVIINHYLALAFIFIFLWIFVPDVSRTLYSKELEYHVQTSEFWICQTESQSPPKASFNSSSEMDTKSSTRQVKNKLFNILWTTFKKVDLFLANVVHSLRLKTGTLVKFFEILSYYKPHVLAPLITNPMCWHICDVLIGLLAFITIILPPFHLRLKSKLWFPVYAYAYHIALRFQRTYLTFYKQVSLIWKAHLLICQV